MLFIFDYAAAIIFYISFTLASTTAKIFIMLLLLFLPKLLFSINCCILLCAFAFMFYTAQREKILGKAQRISSTFTMLLKCWIANGWIFSIKGWSRKQPKLNYWNQQHPKIAFLCHLWQQTDTSRPNDTIFTSSVKAIMKATANKPLLLGPTLGL